MSRRRKTAVKKEKAIEVAINAEGAICDVKTMEPISCLLEFYDNCHGRCKWFSINDEGVALCQDMMIGKMAKKEEEVRKISPAARRGRHEK